MENIIDYETILADELAEKIGELAEKIGEYLGELAEKIGELAEKIGEYLGEAIKILHKQNKPKYKPVKNLIKPYKQPFIKVRYRARANL